MAKFYLETYGCKLNQADSDLIREMLLKEFEEASENEADFFVLNSCGVLEKTERKILNKAKELKTRNKKVIIAGCLPLIVPKKCEKIADGLIGPKNILAISNIAKAILKGERVKIVRDEEIDKAKFCFFKKQKDNCSVIISISEGCLGNCSFCAAKIARGELKSFAMKNVLEKIKVALSLGFKEIQLTGQDLACYGLDEGKFLLPKLLEKITKIKGDFRVKIGMLEPYFLKKILKDVIPIFESKKLYKFFHVPVQSGDNLILKKMRRKYKKEDFLEIVATLEKNFKDYLLATDIIVGFPGETKKAFENTLELIRKTRPQIVNINRFSKRPGTQAFLMKDLHSKIKKERSRILNKLCEKIKIEKSKKYLGKEFEILIVKKGKNNTFLARNQIGKAIILKKGKTAQFAKAKIVDYRSNYLIGKLI